jgi:hypothetical protein
MFNPILPVTRGDLPDCLALAQDREWLSEDHKWAHSLRATRSLLRLGRPLPRPAFLP